MKILDIAQFDRVPTTNLQTTGYQIPGSRFQSHSYAGGGSNDLGSLGTHGFVVNNATFPEEWNGKPWLRCVGYRGGNSGLGSWWNRQLVSELARQPDVADSILTFGFRLLAQGGSGSRFTASSYVAARLRFTDNTTIAVCGIAELPNVGTSYVYYVEVVVDRANKIAHLYVDDLFVRSFDLSASMTNGSEFQALLLGAEGTCGALGYSGFFHSYFRDFYAAEFTAEDPSKRLGPQLVKALPVNEVVADTWTASNATLGKVGCLNDDIGTWGGSAAGSHVVINESDPVGEVSVDFSTITNKDRVNALSVIVDAQGMAGSSRIETALMDGDAVEQADTATFAQTYSATSLPQVNGRARQVAFATPQSLTRGNVSELSSKKLRFKAVVDTAQ